MHHIFFTGISVALTRDSYTVYENVGSVEICVNVTDGLIADDFTGTQPQVYLQTQNFFPIEAIGDHGNNALLNDHN